MTGPVGHTPQRMEPSRHEPMGGGQPSGPIGEGLSSVFYLLMLSQDYQNKGFVSNITFNI